MHIFKTYSFCFSFRSLYSSAGWSSGTLRDLDSLLGPVPREKRRLFRPSSPSALILGVLLQTPHKKGEQNIITDLKVYM